MPPNTSMPGTTSRTIAARSAVLVTWFFSTIPRSPMRLASVAASMSVTLRPNTSGAECTWKSIAPRTGLTTVGGAAGGLGCMLLLTAAVSWSQENPDQRLTEALLQEGLILEAQIAKLQPVAAELDRERKRLQAEETELTDEAAQVTKDFDALN